MFHSIYLGESNVESQPHYGRTKEAMEGDIVTLQCFNNNDGGSRVINVNFGLFILHIIKILLIK